MRMYGTRVRRGGHAVISTKTHCLRAITCSFKLLYSIGTISQASSISACIALIHGGLWRCAQIYLFILAYAIVSPTIPFHGMVIKRLINDVALAFRNCAMGTVRV